MRRVPQIVHLAAEKFQRAASPRRFAFSGALTCIMRYRASLLAECFLPACLPACPGPVVVDVMVVRCWNFRGASFTKGTSSLRSVLYMRMYVHSRARRTYVY